MSNHIPFDIQSEIMKRLPVKSLIQFRSVSKQWKSFIDNPKFIKNYHVNHANPQHHLLVCYELDTVKNYTSIIDNNTFPKQKFPLTAPESLHLFKGTLLLNSVDGLLYFCDSYPSDSKTEMVVIWNPTVRKSVRIVIPKSGSIVVGFGVCPDTNDPKLVKVSVDEITSMWVVEVFTLSTRVWKTVYMGAPFKSCGLTWFHVFVNGVIYFRGYGDVYLDQGNIYNLVISFDLKSEKFGEVCLPQRLVRTRDLNVTKVDESLGFLEYYNEGGMTVCGVWKREDGANKMFTKIYTIKVEGKSVYDSVVGFRNNGEVVMELDDDNYKESRIEVYEPLSGHINDVGINGKRDANVISYAPVLNDGKHGCFLNFKNGHFENQVCLSPKMGGKLAGFADSQRAKESMYKILNVLICHQVETEQDELLYQFSESIMEKVLISLDHLCALSKLLQTTGKWLYVDLSLSP
ncbi:putative pentatricopeptide repeat-containing protein [Tanacetum coccineum]